MAHGLGVRRIDLYLRFDDAPAEEALARVRDLVRRRGDHVPVAYLTGTREFHSLPFHVEPGVLVPRPETEHLVEAALDALRGTDAPVLADVGTGSGCVAVALLHEMPTARAHGTDVSAKALEVAGRNAARHGVRDRLSLHRGHLLEPLRATGHWGRLAAVVSNPPYVVRGDPTLEEGVRRHEPPEALFVPGVDPLGIVRELAEAAREALGPRGLLALEVGAGRAGGVGEALDRLGYEAIETRRDLARIERVVTGRRAP